MPDAFFAAPAAFWHQQAVTSDFFVFLKEETKRLPFLPIIFYGDFILSPIRVTNSYRFKIYTVLKNAIS